MFLPDWLTRRAEGAAETLAVIAGPQRWTYAELNARATNAAALLAGLGVGAGDRIAVLLDNGPHFVVTLHALVKLNAVLVPLNTRLTAAELAWQLEDVRAMLFLCDTRNAERANEVYNLYSALRPVLVDVLTNAPAPQTGVVPARDGIDLDAPLCIIYTSGTTGKPKGVLLTYGNFWWGATGSAYNLGTRPDDVWLAVLPLFHVGGLSILLRGVIYGVTVIVHERFDPAAVNRAIDHEGVTIVSVVSTMLTRMFDEHADAPYPPSLRCLLLGGGPALRPLLERAAAIGAPVVQSYGMTETASQAATLAPADALRKLGSAGKPLLHLDLRVERDGASVPPGEVGEIVVRGGSVTPGYADRPDATAKAIRDGWLHTGDLGRLDAEGYLYVMDRRDDLIISGGENIYPAEVEAVLLAHPDIAEAGVVGLPDAQWGQSVGAAVVVRSGATLPAQAIIEFARTRLARYKVPSHILFLPALPRNAAGKIVRRQIREEFTTRDTETQSEEGE